MVGIDIISGALRLLNVIAVGETPDNDQAQTGMEVLNDMLSAWGTERLMVFNVTRSVFALPTLKQSYTFGIGGDFNAPRPIRIDRCGVLSLNNPAQPLELPIPYTTDPQKWAAIPVKNTASSLVQLVWDDGAFPFRNINCWPIPSIPIQLVFYLWAQFSQLNDLQLDLEFPPGYNEAIKYNLAARLAPELNTELRQDVMALAITSKAQLKSINAPVLEMRCDPAIAPRGRQMFNWLTGE